MKMMNQSPCWYAIWTRSRHEWIAWEELQGKGFHVFFPTVEKLSRRKDRKKILQVPLFSGYLFVKTVLDKETYIRIVRSQGVVDILGYSRGKAEPIPEYEIESVQRLLENKLPVEKHPYIPEGTLVQIISGPLKGVVGIVLSHKSRRKLVVQVELLHQAVACTLPEESVFPLDYQPIPTMKTTAP